MKNLLLKIKTVFEDSPIRFLTPIAVIILSFLLIVFTCLPSSAADEPSEGGQSVAPTNLTDTNWFLPLGYDFTNFTGFYNVSGSVIANDPRDGTIVTKSFDKIGVGYDMRGNYANVHYISFYLNNTGVVGARYDIYTLDITFVGGDDVTNSTLISCLMANGIWTNPSEPEPIYYTIPAGSYLINDTTEMPPLLSPYTYTSRFSYNGKIYTNLVFNRQGIFFIDEAGEHLSIYHRGNVNNPWSGVRNFTLLTEIVTEDEELYNYFLNNTQPYEPDFFDVVVYFISGFFKALDKFVIYYNFSLLDFIFVMCGLLGAVWFLKVLAGG